MQQFNFDSPDFLKEIGSRANDILLHARNQILNHPKFRILKAQYFDKLWQNRINKGQLFTLILREEYLDTISFKKISKDYQTNMFQVSRDNNVIEVDDLLQVVNAKTINFKTSTEAKKYFKDCSRDGYIVVFLGQVGLDIFIKGENTGENNFFYCTEDLTRFAEKKDISQINEVIRSYQNSHLTNQSEYMVFFADNSTLRRIDESLVRRNILKNKPEKYMRDHLRNYLNDRMKHTFLIETELSGSKRELDIYTEVNGEFYFFEIKWIGQSISDCGTKLTNPYGDARAREGVTQTLEYIEEILDTMSINVRTGYLVIFDARDVSEDIDYQQLQFVSPGLKKYMQLFEIIPQIKLNKRHPA
ncbi:hypothetical protein [Paenibacillus sp. JDR-2]|uniref:hypothetical protein n=1 Tax=Paenibacillus sp. (strain JDR-2) TaxID=324057 RepID=UPI000166B0AA|nr:hypothetical protein [Paenibacillus sp. JDR-2]ACS98971.1 hypothetical protein Pjdr2_0291 [Paenibacillus sp. JDR-2]